MPSTTPTKKLIGLPALARCFSQRTNQESIAMSANLSRRALLTSGLAVATAPVAVCLPRPAAANAPVITGSHPDARLLALGEQMKPLFEEWMTRKPKAARLHARATRLAGEPDLQE